MKGTIGIVLLAWLCIYVEAQNGTTMNPNMTTIAETTMATTMPTTMITNITTMNGTTVMMTTSNETTMNMTTAPQPTTSPMMTTAATGVGEWTVLDDKNNTCMKMKFQGFIDNNLMKHVDIPTSATPDNSKCQTDMANFELVFQDKLTDYVVGLQFKIQDKTTTFLWNASVSYINPQTGDADKASEVQYRFATPVGRSFDCDQQKISVGPKFNLTFSEMRLQPFAAYAKNDYGDPYSCIPAVTPNTALIVGLTLGAIIVILLIVVCVLYKKVARSPSRNYNAFT